MTFKTDSRSENRTGPKTEIRASLEPEHSGPPVELRIDEEGQLARQRRTGACGFD